MFCNVIKYYYIVAMDREGEEKEAENKETKPKPEKTEVPVHNNTEMCPCPKSKEQLDEEERDRLMQIRFEDYLHNMVYIKRSALKSFKKTDFKICWWFHYKVWKYDY